MPKTRKLADLELLEGGGAGGMGGGARSSSTLETVGKVAGPAALAMLGGVGGSKLIKNAREKREAEEREAAAELKRESSRGMKKGGFVGSASKRADGIAQRGKTRGKMC